MIVPRNEMQNVFWEIAVRLLQTKEPNRAEHSWRKVRQTAVMKQDVGSEFVRQIRRMLCSVRLRKARRNSNATQPMR